MLRQNKFVKYLLYAIGEIVLVVIGILIALHINNWNNERENRRFEQEILQQIDINLAKDQAELIRIKGNFEKAIVSSEKVLAAMEKGNPHDSIKYWLGDVIQFDRFQPLTNSYEQLKSRGLEHIQNRDLRFLLGSYYDDQANHMVKSIGDIEAAFNDQWAPLTIEAVEDFVFKQYVVFRDQNILRPEEIGGTILKLNKDNFRGGVFRISVGLDTVNTIRDMISEELAKFE